MRDVMSFLRSAVWAARVIGPFGRPYRRYLVRGWLGALLVVACRLAFPWPLRGAMEIAFHKTGGRGGVVASLVPSVGGKLAWLVGAFTVIVLAQGLGEYVQRLGFARYAVGLSRDARAVAMRALAESGSLAAEPGDATTRIIGDASRVRSGVKVGLISLTRNGIFSLGVTAILSVIDLTIAMVFLGGGLAALAIGLVGAGRVHTITRRSRRRESKLAATLHLHSTGEVAADKLPKALEPGTSADSKATRVEGATTFVVHVAYSVSTCAILALAIDAGRTGRLSFGSVFTVLAYVLLMHNRTVRLGRTVVRAGKLLASATRLAEVVSAPKPLAGSGASSPASLGTVPVRSG